MLLPFCMITAIYLYNHSTTPRDEIHYIIAYHMLPKELHPQGIISKLFPQYRLCKGCTFSVFSCVSL